MWVRKQIKSENMNVGKTLLSKVCRKKVIRVINESFYLVINLALGDMKMKLCN